MWRSFLDLLTACRRPLVFIDFETAGLGGAPPVEFAMLFFAPWDPPSDDEVTRRAAKECPPGLTYAVNVRTNPIQPIDPGATRVHRITDADVRDCQPYNDLELRVFFQVTALGDDKTGERPAVFVGHNAAEADVPWARRWGYLPPADHPAPIDLIDTMRIARRIGRTHPYPLVCDIIPPIGDEQRAHVPAYVVGLDAYASSLVGVHAALTGRRHDAHGALADCCATARVLARLLELWSSLLPPRRGDLTPDANLGALLAALDAPEPGVVSWDGWLAEAETEGGGFTWHKGKHRGKPATIDPSYRQWVRSLPRHPTGVDGEAWCSQHTADILASLPALQVAR